MFLPFFGHFSSKHLFDRTRHSHLLVQTMKSAMVLGAVLLCVALCLQSVLSVRYTADDRALDSPYAAREQLANLLLEIAQRNDHAHKRNSEIINSLLGLPKVLNDAGRK